METKDKPEIYPYVKQKAKENTAKARSKAALAQEELEEKQAKEEFKRYLRNRFWEG